VLSGSCIQAYHATQRHILACEEHNDIFNAIIAPQMRKTVVNCAKPPSTIPNSFALEEKDVEPECVVMTN